MKHRVIRVRTAETFFAAESVAFFERAIRRARYPGTRADELIGELGARISEDRVGVFVGLEGEVPRAVVVIYLPSSAAMIAPQAILAYSEHRPLMRLIGARARDWLMASGYRRLLGMNLHHPDRVWLRAFRHFARGRVIGSLCLFEF